MAGREGLLDTAVKTTETDYMQRRLVKALEDLVSHYDGLVRNCCGDVIQFIYGDDCLNPSNMEEGANLINFNRLLQHICAINLYKDESPLSSEEIRESLRIQLEKVNKNVSESFKQEICTFIENYATRFETFQERYAKYLDTLKTHFCVHPILCTIHFCFSYQK
jgi:DNA-directed RNA polymerase III subunit RPC1